MALQITELHGRKYITITNARVNFGALLDYIKATGESLLITRRGKPVVKIAPLARSEGRGS